MNEIQKKWLYQFLSGMVKNPEKVDFCILKGRCDLEIILFIEEEDKAIFSEEVISSLKEEIASKTGVLSPAVYLEDNEPEWLKQGQYIIY